jgi:hypothetical protein
MRFIPPFVFWLLRQSEARHVKAMTLLKKSDSMLSPIGADCSVTEGKKFAPSAPFSRTAVQPCGTWGPNGGFQSS